MTTVETYSDFPPILQRAMTFEDLESVFAVECLAHSRPCSISNIRNCITSGYHCQVLEQNGDIVAFGITSTVIVEVTLAEPGCILKPLASRAGTTIT